MDKFLTYVAEEWKKENEIELHNGIKLEMMQSFMDGMKNLFEENYVELPEEKYNVMQEMTDKLDEMEAKASMSKLKPICLSTVKSTLLLKSRL